MNRAGLRALRVGACSTLVRPKALACLAVLMLAACVLTVFGLTHGSLPIPASAIGRALFSPESLNVGRLAFLPLQLPAGIVISLIGGPFFLLLLWQRRDRF